MKYYSLNYSTALKSVVSKKKFKSRNAAINYAFNQFASGTQLDYEHKLGNKHTIEYVCNNHTRFIISRCFA